MTRALYVASTAIGFAFLGNPALGQEPAEPKSDDLQSREYCMYEGQEYSIGAFFCAGSGVMLQCNSPGKTGPNGEEVKKPHWFRNTMDQCKSNPSTTPG